MPHQSDRLHVQENRLAPRAGIGHRLCASAQGIVHVRTVAAYIMQSGPMREIGRDPPARCAHGNPNAIILTQEHNRHGQMLIRRPTRRVERTLRR